MLSFVAGIVNISGVLSIATLTTNLTGHFAFFSEEFVQGNYQTALNYISYIIAFLFGAFLCSFLVKLVLRSRPEMCNCFIVRTEC
jgi:Predicted membrane protein